MMNYSIKVQTLLQIEKRKWLLLVGLVALTHLFCQSLMLPYGTALLSLLPDGKYGQNLDESPLTSMIGNNAREVGTSSSSIKSVKVSGARSTNSYNLGGDVDYNGGSIEKDKQENLDFSLDVDNMDNDSQFVEDETLENVDMDLKDEFAMENDRSQENGVKDANTSIIPSVVSQAKPLLIKSVVEKMSRSVVNSSAGSLPANNPVKKKMRCEMPPRTVMPINEMKKLLVRGRRAARPRWPSERDQEIMAAKLKIENAPVLKNDRDLYAPLFRNISMFKRSYEQMERVLKIYVYKEGEKPIFHTPVLKGLYASEGWFMKLMERNTRFVVKDPRKAHLFYMPFSSRMLEYSLYVRNSHNRTNLRQYLKDYSEKIATKYRFWNRTGGADHFLVACHDWAPYETRHHMEQCIKALCNADVTMGFKIGRDVSLPETYVRSARNPLRDLGGKPPSQRHILCFYAGSMHGYLRPILLKHWKDKEPDMKILGRMPLGVASKMNYINHMKSSKYCICPKGYEVNSPRIVESIFYECVPVIISDNFVPPFFEVMNWEAFSVVLEEKDVPNLRDILVSIPEQKYLDLQLGVRKVQRHFLWHAKPIKYDLFHMTLHSIWYNRVFQMKLR